jgi:hypothetical protein
MTNHSANPLTALAVEPTKTFLEVQDKGEEVYLLIRRHAITNTWWVLFFLVVLVAPLIAFSEFGREVLGLAEVFTLFSTKSLVASVIIWYLYVYLFVLQNSLLWFFNVLIITNERIIDLDVSWPFHRFVSEVQLYQIQDVSFRQSGFLSSIFDYGGVHVQTAGSEQNIELRQAPNPALIHDKITDLVQKASQKHPNTKV